MAADSQGEKGDTGATGATGTPGVGRGELFAAVNQLVADNQRLIRLLGEASVVSNRHRIRWAITTIIIAVVMAVQMHDLHVLNCMAGLPTSRVAQFACDASWPTHTHDGHFPAYPVPGQAVGLLAYAFVIGGSVAWAGRERRREVAADAAADALVNTA